MAFRSLGILMIASTAGVLAPAALAAPEPPAPAPAPAPGKVPCATLDNVQESLDDDLDDGISGLRDVISSPYLSIAWQKGNADEKLNKVAHGITYMEDLNEDNPVPGLGKILHKMDRGMRDMRDAVDTLFPMRGGWGYGGLRAAFPQQGTWDTIDYVDDQRQAAADLVSQLRGSCS